MSFRILFYVLICSSILTLITSAIQLYFDYQKDVNQITKNFHFIEESYLPAINANLYQLDYEQLQILIDGVLKIQDIVYLEIYSIDDKTFLVGGDSAAQRDISQSYKIGFNFYSGNSEPIGNLVVHATLAGVQQRLIDKAAIILVTNLIKTLFASVIFLFIIQYLCTRHLKTMADFTDQLNLSVLDNPLILSRTTSKVEKFDELDRVVESMNDMRLRLKENIVDQQQTEIVLKERESFINNLVATAPVLIYIYDIAQSKNTYANVPISEILGYSPSDIRKMGKTFISEMVHEDDLSNVINHHKKLSNTDIGEIFEIEYRMRNIHGNWIWLLSRDTPYKKSDSGITTQILGCALDITKRKGLEKELNESRENLEYQVKKRTVALENVIADRVQAEKQLQQSQVFLQRAIEGGRVAVWEWNIKNNHVEWSKNAGSVLGFPEDAFKNNFESYIKWIHPDDILLFKEQIGNALTNDKNYHSEYRVIRPDGITRWILASGKIFQDATGEANRIIGTMADITNKKASDDELAFQASLLEQIHNAVITVDLNNKILSWNPYAEKLYQWTTEEAIGRNMVELLTPGKNQEITERNLIKQRSKDHWEGEYDVMKKDGKMISTYVINTPLTDNKGDHVGFIGISTDITERKKAREELAKYHDNLEALVKDRTIEMEKEITERKQAESALRGAHSGLEEKVRVRTDEFKRAKEEAEEANKAKSDFLSNMSHEIRTPMHQILSFAKFGVDKTGNVDESKLINYFSKIGTAGKGLLSLLNNLLDLSKLESGKMDYDMVQVDIKDIINYVSTEFDALIDEKDITLKIEESDLPTILTCDEQKIGQVVRNLLSNALKFTPPEEDILISFESNAFQKEKNSQLNSNSLRVIVNNKGVGIPTNELESIFDKFNQSSTTKTGAGGTGLGLAISREIISVHNGKIWAENNPELGTRFCFELPYKFKPI